MSKMNEKSREMFDNTALQSKISTAKPKKHPKIEQHIPTYSLIEEENTIYVTQLQELARIFSSIESSGIRQYGINLMRELAKCETEEKAKVYALEMMG